MYGRTYMYYVVHNKFSVCLSVTSETSCMLMDAGEDTLGQLHRFYQDHAPEVLSKLQAVFISHRHADHHMVRIILYSMVLLLYGPTGHRFYQDQTCEVLSKF